MSVELNMQPMAREDILRIDKQSRRCTGPARARSIAIGTAIVAVSLLGTSIGRAQPAPDVLELEAADPNADKPWFPGVSAADRQAARTIFRDGAILHSEAFYRQAIEKYEQALGHWQHPGIDFNMARALRDLGRLVEAYRAFKQATRFGPISLSAEEYEMAQQLMRELEKQLVRLEVTCEVDEAEVYIDDEQVFQGPGTYETMIVPGPHRLVTQREGYVKDEQWIQLTRGEHRRVTLRPLSFKEVAFVDVGCVEKGASVILDGKPFIKCPGKKSQMLTPEVEHMAIITHPERLPHQEMMTPAKGQRLVVDMRTVSKDDLVRERPIPRWIAWAVLGGGVLVAAGGGALRWSAAGAIDAFERDFDLACPIGCAFENVPDLRDRYDSAQLRDRLAIATMSLGVSVLLAGAALELWNQPRVVKRERASERQAVRLRPSITTEEVGIVADMRF